VAELLGLAGLGTGLCCCSFAAVMLTLFLVKWSSGVAIRLLSKGNDEG